VREEEGPLQGVAPPDSTVIRNRRVAALLIVLPAVLLMLGGLLWRGSGRRVVTRLPGTLRTLQLTTSAGLDHSPSFSPDDSNIAYASDRSGSFEIYVRGVGAGSRELQITRDGGQNVQPAFSPDGKEIAYYSARKQSIQVVPALGGFARMVSEFGCEPAWSPDGEWIAFRSGGFISLAATELAPPATARIWVVPRAGGKPRQITFDGQPPGKHGRPRWSPDGKKILFASYGPQASLWTVEVSTGKLNRLPLPDGSYIHPVFSPEGRSLYYVARSQDLDFGIWRWRMDRNEPPLELHRAGLSIPADLAVSSNGRRLSFGLARLTSNLASLRISEKTGEPVGDPIMLTRDTSFRNTFPAISPDGLRIAYHVRRQGVESDIYVMNADGSEASQVTTNPEPDVMPNWTPDGKGLVFSSGREGSNKLWRVSLDTGKEEMLVNTPSPKVMARLSPAADQLVFYRMDRGRMGVWRMDLAGGEPLRLSEPGENVGYPCWSRDGKWIAAERLSGENTQIVVLPAGGGKTRQLTNEAGQHWSYSWSPDSKRVAMAAMRDGAWNLWWVDTDTGRQQKLTGNSLTRVFLRYPEWSPRGGFIVYEQAETRGNLYLLELR